MTGQIVTARHGRPHVDRSVKITAREYGTWWQNYDLAGLAPGQEPPQGLVDIATASDVVLSSTLPRAIETASKAVCGAREVEHDAIFVEAPLPPPPISFIKLTPTTWGVVSRSFWFWGYAPGDCENHAQAWKRVGLVADRLIGVAANGNDVLLCAHGYLNWMLDRQIKSRGWTKIAHEGGNDYWSHRTYRQLSTAAPTATQSKIGNLSNERY